MEYSRYTGNEEAERGVSMVEKHILAKKRSNREASIASLHAAWPQVKEEMIVTALESCNWDADKAFKALSMFKVTNVGSKGKAKEGEKEKEKDKKKEKEHKKKKRKGSDSDSESDSEGSGSSDSDSSDKKHKKHKKEKSKKKKHKKEKEKKEKKEKKDKDKKGAVTEQFGLFGVVKESDLWNKRPEFILWCSEIKKIDAEMLSKWEEKDAFSEYMEDYNTATLPHKKYYNYEAWLLSEQDKANKKKGKRHDEKTTFNDEEDKKRELLHNRMRAREQEVQMLRSTMRASGKVDDMREQELLRQQMSVAYKTGDVNVARSIAARLAPDAPA